MQNAEIARRFEEVAELLTSHGANPYRANAYSQAAQTLRHLAKPVAGVYQDEGWEGLTNLPET